MLQAFSSRLPGAVRMNLWRYVGLVVLSLVLLLAALIGFAPTWLHLGLKLQGIDDVTFSSLDIGLKRLELKGLAFGAPANQSVALIGVDYTLSGLLGGQVDRVTMNGLIATLALDDLKSSEQGEALPLLAAETSVREFILEKSRIDIETPGGLLSVPLSGHVKTIDDRIGFSLMADAARLGDLEHGISADLAIGGELSPGDGPILDRLTAAGRMSLQAREATIPGIAEGLDGDALMTLEVKDGDLGALDHGRLSLDVTDLSLNDISLLAVNAHLAFNGKQEALRGNLALHVDGLNWSSPSFGLSDLDLEQRLALAFDGRVLDLLVPEQGRISVGQASVTDQAESGWFTARLDPSDVPLIRIDVQEGGWQHQLRAEVDPVRLDTASGQWWARIENLTLAATSPAKGPISGQVMIKQGRADLPSANLALTGIESELRLNEDGIASDPVPITIRAVRPLEGPRWFSPLRLDATLKAAPERLLVDGRLTSGTKPAARIIFSGHHQPETHEGMLDFELPKLTLDPGGLQPEDLSPALADVLGDTSGRIALAGRFQWLEGDLSSMAELLIEELGLTIGPARLERVNSLLRFDNLIPLTTEAGQELAIGLLDAGLPLTDGLVSMQLGADGKLAVDQLTWRFADGKVNVRPFTFGSDVQDLTMVLDADQLDLKGLLELTDLDGLSGEGRIDGALPLTISEAGAIITDGKLEATDAGILRYRPKSTPSAFKAGGASIGLMLQALENFHYDELKITLDGRTDGETDIGLHIRGANPDLYEGHPIEFNLDLEGDLATIIRTNLSSYQIPDRIRERLQKFGQ